MKTPLTLCHPLLSCDSYSPNATCAADGTESIVVIHMQISVYSSYAKCIRAEHPNFGRTPTKTRTVSEWHPVVLSTWQNKEGNSVFYLSACCEIHSTLLHSFLAIKKKKHLFVGGCAITDTKFFYKWCSVNRKGAWYLNGFHWWMQSKCLVVYILSSFWSV